ncbi:unnamed protein product, partial [Discosporangium mesarthrocarpum]
PSPVGGRLVSVRVDRQPQANCGAGFQGPMDPYGNCLIMLPCETCRQHKAGVKSCLARQHNPKLQTVKRSELQARHRLCIKPEQEKTIYKLVDHVTGQESIEFNESIVFQVPCDQCQGIKACITSGHSLVDWHVDSFINSGSGQGQKRKAGPATPTSSRAVTSGLPSPKSSPAPQVRRLAREGSSGGEGGGEDFPELAEPPTLQLVNTGTIMEQIERIPVARKKLKRDFLEKMSRFEEVEAIKKAELKEVQGALARIQQLKELWRHGTQRHNRTLDETWQQLMQARIK